MNRPGVYIGNFDDSPIPVDFDPDYEAKLVLEKYVDNPRELYDVVEGLVYGRFGGKVANETTRLQAWAWLNQLLRPHGLQLQQLFASNGRTLCLRLRPA